MAWRGATFPAGPASVGTSGSSSFSGALQELRTGNVTREDILAMAEQLVGPDYVPR